ncbi:hypothetical protein B0A80_01580 [Flavobacterium tructae]|uniref:hypothetical protein n=1 Tax=Flavobacterium tructae TaxID=1114873 RepID=UPI000B5BE172|nr:hypothetical protein [Flavobacterium tructae]OXB25351.1 hypothetical protein B0A80_01580 [Flavobacterium tructae]
MRTLRTKYLSNIPINEDNYKVDFIILEKYQSFSSEILRLSLLGLTIYGFLITNVIFKITDKEDKLMSIESFSDNKVLLLLGAVTLILAALVTLGHRYLSTHCMTHFIKGLRLRQNISEIESTVANDKNEFITLSKKIDNEQSSFEKNFNLCGWLLFASCLFLITGILIVTIALACFFNDILMI